MKIIAIYEPGPGDEQVGTDLVKLRVSKTDAKVYLDGQVARKKIASLSMRRKEGEPENWKFKCTLLPETVGDKVTTTGHDIHVVRVPSLSAIDPWAPTVELTYDSNYGPVSVTDQIEVKVGNSAQSVSIRFKVVVGPPEGPPPHDSGSPDVLVETLRSPFADCVA